MPTTKAPYPEEFRQQTVVPVLTGRTLARLARGFNCTRQKAFRPGSLKPLSQVMTYGYCPSPKFKLRRHQ